MPVSVRVEQAQLEAGHEGFLDLTGDLRLADDHRVETRGHAEEVLDDISVAEDVEVLFEVFARSGGAIGHPVDDGLDDVFARRGDDRLHAIARRDDASTLDSGQLRQRLDDVRQLRLGDAEPLAHLDRRCPVIHADEEKRHDATSRFPLNVLRSRFGTDSADPDLRKQECLTHDESPVWRREWR
jgi:hypothetical protein